MKEQKMKFKISIALLCALLLACFICAVFLPLLHDCAGEMCEVCAAADILGKMLGGVALLASFRFCTENTAMVRLWDGYMARRGESTPVSLKVKLSN